jgi:hypothetical protein
MLSIVIPSKTEMFLKKTIEDVLSKATGNIEIYPVLDGYVLPPEELVLDSRVHYQYLPSTTFSKKRQAINMVAEISHGEHFMCIDAHCMVGPGFDEIIVKDLDEDCVAVPRRNRLDAANWCVQNGGKPPIDYEYLIWQKLLDVQPCIYGVKWDTRTLERLSVPIDEIVEFQGSCWVMHKSHFNRCGFMDLRYQGYGQESEEISFTTWLTGGRVVSNKNTWYAHLRKGRTYGRMYYLPRDEFLASVAYSWDFWINDRPLPNRVHNLEWLIEKFLPMPGWPADWKEQLGNRRLRG